MQKAAELLAEPATRFRYITDYKTIIPPLIVRRALEAKKYDNKAVIYSVTFIRGSPRAVEISAMDFSVRLGKPEVHRDMAASDRPILRAKSFCVRFFCFRMASMRAMISADNCTSETISGDTAAIFSLNHSCLFLIANVMSSVSDRSFFFKLQR